MGTRVARGGLKKEETGNYAFFNNFGEEAKHCRYVGTIGTGRCSRNWISFKAEGMEKSFRTFGVKFSGSWIKKEKKKKKIGDSFGWKNLSNLSTGNFNINGDKLEDYVEYRKMRVFFFFFSLD